MADEKWLAESIRLTVFPSQVAPLQDSRDWWAMVGKSDPEFVSEKPKLGQYQAAGSLLNEKAQLIISLEPERIDWQLAPSREHVESATELVPSLGDWQEMADYFCEMIDPWLGSACPAISRLAIGAVLHQTVNGRREGYEKLSGLLKESVILDVDNSSDFSYSINRPRESTKFCGLRINRLSKWGVANIRLVRVPLPTGEVKLISPKADSFSCRLELDINTQQDFEQEIPKEKMIPLFLELLSLAKEIAQKGDIK